MSIPVIDKTLPRRSHSPITMIGAFLFFGASMALLAGTTLIWKGTFLDRMWILNAHAYERLTALGKLAGVPFLALSATLAIAGVGWFRRRLWGSRLATIIIAAQTVGDLIAIFMGHMLRGATGVLIAGALLLFMLRSEVRGKFAV